MSRGASAVEAAAERVLKMCVQEFRRVQEDGPKIRVVSGIATGGKVAQSACSRDEQKACQSTAGGGAASSLFV